MSTIRRLPDFLRHLVFCYKHAPPKSYWPLTGLMVGYVLTTLGWFRTRSRLVHLDIANLSLDLNAFSGEVSGLWENFQDDKYGLGEQAAGNRCVFDIGANAGFFSMRQISTGGKGLKLFAFEPDPAVFSRASQHLARCNRGKEAEVSINNCACGSNTGTAGFVRDGSCLSHISQDQTGGRNRIDVRIDTLDRLVVERGVAHIDLMKIDVEGHEMEVLKGGAGKALPITDRIVLQYHPGQFEEVRKFLEAAGFKASGGFPAKETAFFSRL
jgi:FkbM family methyltransferase